MGDHEPNDGSSLERSLESDAVLWSIPISCARVDVESVADVFDPKNKKKQEQLLDHVRTCKKGYIPYLHWLGHRPYTALLNRLILICACDLALLAVPLPSIASASAFSSIAISLPVSSAFALL